MRPVVWDPLVVSNPDTGLMFDELVFEDDDGMSFTVSLQSDGQLLRQWLEVPEKYSPGEEAVEVNSPS